VRSDVEISGGDFGPGSVILAGSTSRITGGKIDRLQLFPDIVSPTPPFQFGPGCTEIRGGVLNRVHVQGPGERLIVFGTSFDRALGPIEAPPPSDPPMVLEPPVTTPLSGVLESGEPIGFELSISSMTQVSLAAPGDPGCPQSGR
jgi:hypothetical protein